MWKVGDKLEFLKSSVFFSAGEGDELANIHCAGAVDSGL
jgi:hypothetical protein